MRRKRGEACGRVKRVDGPGGRMEGTREERQGGKAGGIEGWDGRARERRRGEGRIMNVNRGRRDRGRRGRGER